VERSRLPTGALLNIVYSSSLSVAVVALSFRAQPTRQHPDLLLRDTPRCVWLIWADLGPACSRPWAYLPSHRRDQILLTQSMNRFALLAWGAVPLIVLLFISLLALVVAISIKAVGVLLIRCVLW